MSRSNRFPRLCGLAAIACLAVLAFAPGSASAWTLDTRHIFCKQAGCSDGSGPTAALVMADKRHFFGTASGGGAHANGADGGVVYELIHNKDGTWTYKAIYSFCAQTNCADGNQPLSDLIVDQDGNLYGTTWTGGAHAGGTVFKLTKSTGWTENVIYNFCSVRNSNGKCLDGEDPQAGLTYAGQASGAPWDEFSPLYGTTVNGGKYGSSSNSHNGVVFKLVSDGSVWDETVIHNFGTSRSPFGGMVMDGAGNLYGATTYGGTYGGGLFYKLAHDTWTETVLHYFCAQTNCADGANMESRPVIDANGNLYGTTVNLGADGAGGVFELVHGTSGYSYKVLKNFCSPSCSDAGESGAGLAIDGAGNLYGATEAGGANNSGAVFKLHHGTNGWNETLLYSFCSLSGCKDGSTPWIGAAPILDAQGDLFGTTFKGGDATSNAGTVFELTP